MKLFSLCRCSHYSNSLSKDERPNVSICCILTSSSPLLFFMLTYWYPQQHAHTHGHTVRHTPTSLYVSCRRGLQGRRCIKEWGTLEVEQKKHLSFPGSDEQLPPTAALYLHHHRSPPGPSIGLSCSDYLWHTHTHTLSYTLVSCSCCACTALLPQHAAPGGVSSSHGGSVQRKSSCRASSGGQEPHPCEQGEDI